MHRTKAPSQLSRSSYQLQEVLDQKQFSDLASQINMAAHQREHLIDTLYSSNSWSRREQQFTRKMAPQPKQSAYEQAYRKWKGESPGCSFNQTYQSTISLLNKQKQMPELARLMKEYKVGDALYQFNESNKEMTQIKDLYTQELQRITNKRHSQQFQPSKQRSEAPMTPFQRMGAAQKVNEVVKRREQSVIVKKQRMVELAVQKELLTRLRQINEQEREAEEAKRQGQQLQKTCFVEMIKKPPPESWKNKEQQMKTSYHAILKRNAEPVKLDDSIKKKSVDLQRNSQINGKANQDIVEPRYKLDIEKILQIPHKQFLIFYSEYYHLLLGLSSPQQMQRLSQYRDEALQKEEALQRLKQKIASFGPQKIAMLPAAKREKLFKVLYEEDVDIQKAYEP